MSTGIYMDQLNRKGSHIPIPVKKTRFEVDIDSRHELSPMTM